jgi:hypothetical protein
VNQGPGGYCLMKKTGGTGIQILNREIRKIPIYSMYHNDASNTSVRLIIN